MSVTSDIKLNLVKQLNITTFISKRAEIPPNPKHLTFSLTKKSVSSFIPPFFEGLKYVSCLKDVTALINVSKIS